MSYQTHSKFVTDPQYTYHAVVRSIYDGDSLRVDIDLGFKIWRFNEPLRLHGIDAPEIRGKERPLGLEAKKWLSERIPPGTKIIITTYRDQTGKYGRYLADLWHDGENLNAEMLELGLCEPYE